MRVINHKVSNEITAVWSLSEPCTSYNCYVECSNIDEGAEKIEDEAKHP